jgi:hypothetical protein
VLKIKKMTKKNSMLILALLSAGVLWVGVVKAQAPFANYDHWIANGDVYSITEDANYVYSGGNFSYVGPPTGCGAKITSTSTNPDLSFCRPNAAIECAISDGSGGWYIGGYFTSIATSFSTTVTRNGIAHIISSGQLDMTWNPDADGAVLCLALSGSDLYVGGSFTSIGGQNRNHIAKLSTTGTGSADVTWNPNPDGDVYCLTSSGSDLYVGGLFTNIGGQIRNNIAKLSITGIGAADFSWDPNADAEVYCMVISGSDVFVGGSFTTIGGQNRNYIAKLPTSGTGAADAIWNPNADNQINAIALSGSDIFLGGSFTSIGGQARNNIAKISASGTGNSDASWNPNANNSVTSLTVDGSDLYAGGIFTQMNSQNRNRIAKLSTSGAGTVDPLWNPKIDYGIVSAIAFSGTALYIGGSFTSIGGFDINSLARFSKITGIADSTWNPNPNGNVWCMTIADNAIYIGGLFSQVNGISRNNIAKLSITTDLVDPLWNPSANNQVYALVNNGSDLFVGGTFTIIDGQPRNRLAKLSTTGTGLVDAIWNPNAYTSTGGAIRSLALSGSDLYVGGVFTNIGGQARSNIAKLITTGAGSADITWNPNSNNTVYSLALSGDALFAAGLFTNIGAQPLNYFAKLSLAGAGLADLTCNPNPNSWAYSILPIGGDLYVGGSFSVIGGETRNHVAKLKPTGEVDLLWNPDVTGSTVWSLSGAQTHLYIGGNFTSVGGIGQRCGLALIGDLCGPTTPVLAISNDSICSGQSVTLSILSGSLNSASEWVWYNSSCGTGLLGSGTSINDSPAITTTYYLRGEGGCVGTSSTCQTITIHVDDCLGNLISEGMNNETEIIYPNPASLYVTIELPGNDELLPYELINTEGQVVQSGMITGKVTLSTNKLLPGMYFVKITTENGILREKFIIE